MVPDVHVILLGKTGSGKSASGNTILGGDRMTFVEGNFSESVTTICKSEYIELNGQKITVFDTVGLYDTPVKTFTAFQPKIEQIFDCARDGLDVFLLVIRLGVKFTEEERNTVNLIQENFGAKFLKHTIVLFTYGDELTARVEMYMNKCEALRSVVDQCSGRYHVFDNKTGDPEQVTELLEKINKLKMINGTSRYTKSDYKDTQDKISKSCAAEVEEAAARAPGADRMVPVELTAGQAAAAATVAVAVVGAGVLFFARKV